MLSKTQFELLTCLEKAQERLTQRQMAKELQLSLATLNRLHTELQDAGLADFISTKKGVGYIIE